MPQSQPLQFVPEMLSSLRQTFTSEFAPSSTGSAGGAGRGSAAEGEGGRGGQAGRPAGQEREGDTEEGHQEGEAETQDYLQGSFSLKHSDFDWRESQLFSWCCYVSISVLTPQNWNYFADDEADSVKMMEEVEKLCDRLELTR